MSDTEGPTGEKGDSPLVDVSVSGTPFTLPRSLLSGTDWILSKIPDGGVPWGTHHEGRYYIDADPVAFRWALHFLRYDSLPSDVLDTKEEAEALRRLADFLCYENLVEYMDSDAAAAKEAKEAWEGEKRRMEVEIEKQKKENERYRSKVDRIDRMDGCIVRCTKCSEEITVFWKQRDSSTLTSWKCNCGKENDVTRRFHAGKRLVGKRPGSNYSDFTSKLGR